MFRVKRLEACYACISGSEQNRSLSRLSVTWHNIGHVCQPLIWKNKSLFFFKKWMIVILIGNNLLERYEDNGTIDIDIYICKLQWKCCGRFYTMWRRGRVLPRHGPGGAVSCPGRNTRRQGRGRTRLPAKDAPFDLRSGIIMKCMMRERGWVSLRDDPSEGYED